MSCPNLTNRDWKCKNESKTQTSCDESRIGQTYSIVLGLNSGTFPFGQLSGQQSFVSNNSNPPGHLCVHIFITKLPKLTTFRYD